MGGAGENDDGTARRPRMQHEGGTADEHGRTPGVPSRTGTGAQPPADAERVARANEPRTRTVRGLKRDEIDRSDEERDWPQ
ncbi:hypothetical protein EDD91_7193 [Streptomyces sp. KS 21]|nr:hypothetical protein EDD91_7193 [Streptomyces sp. KS 21]